MKVVRVFIMLFIDEIMHFEFDLVCSKSCFLWADETNSLEVVVFKY